jgi:ketosteroid isomerase-like protein
MSEAREISDRLTELINTHDAQAIGDLFAEDGVLVDPSGEFRGRAAIVEYWEGFFRAFPSMSGADTFSAESGDTAINEWTASGAHEGPLDGPEGTIEPTGKTVTIRGADAITVRDGKITSQRVYYDQLAFMIQLGLVPEPAAAS